MRMKKALLPTLALLAALVIVVGCMKKSPAAADPTATPVPAATPIPKKVFVTSQQYTGIIGSLSAADAICQTLAGGAGLGGTWKVWLSNSSTNAIDRIADVGPWVTTNNTIAVLGKISPAEPLQGYLNRLEIENPIEYDENGTKLPVGGKVWTGSFSDGTKDIRTCVNWTSNAIGQGAMTGIYTLKIGWSVGFLSTCDVMARLYCFEQ